MEIQENASIIKRPSQFIRSHNSILHKFLKYKNISSAKKEFLRLTLIRASSKAIKIALKANSNRDKKFFSLFKEKDWQNFCKYCREKEDVLRKVITERPNGDNKNFKSYNDNYCLGFYFACKEIRSAFEMFLNMIFADKDPDLLIKITKVRCCMAIYEFRSETNALKEEFKSRFFKIQHDGECRSKWMGLNLYLREMILNPVHFIQIESFSNTHPGIDENYQDVSENQALQGRNDAREMENLQVKNEEQRNGKFGLN